MQIEKRKKKKNTLKDELIIVSWQPLTINNAAFYISSGLLFNNEFIYFVVEALNKCRPFNLFIYLFIYLFPQKHGFLSCCSKKQKNK